ncbi:MAG TPA: ROK family protein, partial [Candidatus Thermoplasmatota archaeon]|nr:ROK family protein [Candidatus Thermoplasmatota archaeon]
MAAPRSSPSGKGRSLAVGIDVGATKLLAAAVDARGSASHVVRVETPSADGPDAVVRAMVDAVTACRDASGGTLASVGIGFAGQVSGDVVRSSPNLAGWRDVPLAARLRRRLGV